MTEVRKNGTILQIFSNLQEMDLSNIDAFDYDRNLSIVRIFNNGNEVKKIKEIDSEVWKSIQSQLGHDFLRYPWASFKKSCIINQNSFNEELKVTFTKTTFIRTPTR